MSDPDAAEPSADPEPAAESGPTPRRWLWVLVVLGVLVVLALLCVLGSVWDSANPGEGVIIGATIGTALGTLALAGTTYALARATRQTVREAGYQLAELKEQGKVVAEQARIAAEQAAATSRLADSSRAGALAAEKARVDAIAPLVQCTVTPGPIRVLNREQQELPYDSDQTWYTPQLEGLRFVVALKFELVNLGKSPALIAFGGVAGFFRRVSDEKLSPMWLFPLQRFTDWYEVNLTGPAATAGELLKVAITYDGMLHGEMFDHVQWNGWVTPLIENPPGVARWNEVIVNASGAQVMRTYPNLDRPEEMAEVRQRLME